MISNSSKGNKCLQQPKSFGLCPSNLELLQKIVVVVVVNTARTIVYNYYNLKREHCIISGEDYIYTKYFKYRVASINHGPVNHEIA